MPLSEHEERILAEIERQLAAEDPRFAARARRRAPWSGLTKRSRMRIAVLTAIIGLVGVLFIGILTTPWDLISGAAGLLLLLAAILLGVTASTEPDQPAQQHAPPDDRL